MFDVIDFERVPLIRTSTGRSDYVSDGRSW